MDLAHRVFEEQAERTPKAIALAMGAHAMSYEELDRRADALAARLQARGVGPDVLVGLYADRSFEMVIGFLGIMKAGGAVVPLDPAYPRARLQFMIADSAMRVAVVTPGTQPLAPDWVAEIVAVDDGPEVDVRRRESALSLDHLAYVIFTSGSTGQPKGVMVTHRGLTNLARVQIEAFRISRASRVLQFSSLSFDASVSEILMVLLSGATLVLSSQSDLRPGAELVRTLRDQRITTVTLPPSVLAVLPPDDLPDLATVVSAGEALSLELCAAWSRTHYLVNAYGPSEVTVCATIARDVASQPTVTIGRPIANTRIYILDGVRQVAPGEIGEICIAGVGLARGYLNRPEQTAERFVSDPFSEQPATRMYRTGDLARWLPDRSIEYIGRADSQIKIRGFRVELGEIESTLRAHPAVRSVAVVVRPEHRSLLAFVIKADREVSIAALREYLAARVPDYMIPAFVIVDQFPLTPNGKVDRDALLDRPLPVHAPGQVPRNPLEQIVATAWTEALGLEVTDVLADFASVGGDSLKAATVASNLQKVLGETVYTVAIFDHPTIAALAEYLREHYAESVARLVGGASDQRSAEADPPVTPEHVELLRRLMGEFSPYRRPAPRPGRRNRRMVFVLSPPRSGSTLFRVMLAGNRNLFVPQELGLLAFERLGDHGILANGYEWISQGAIRTLMEIRAWTVDEAKAHLAECETAKTPTQEMYRDIQDRVHPKLLVDKTTTYALDPSILQRAESDFEEPLYIHLLRHPCGMIRSFEKVRMDRFFFRWDDKPLFSPSRLAELVWYICHENTVAFLKTIPKHRQCVVRYEDVVKDPRAQMQALCASLGIPFDEGMVEPHRDTSGKMIDGIYQDEASRQIGDPNFHKHDSIDSRRADAWREDLPFESLGLQTRALASSFGY